MNQKKKLTLYELHLVDTKKNITYTCIYHPDDAGVKLIFSNVFDNDLVELFPINKTDVIKNHIQQYGAEIEKKFTDKTKNTIFSFFKVPKNHILILTNKK